MSCSSLCRIITDTKNQSGKSNHTLIIACTVVIPVMIKLILAISYKHDVVAKIILGLNNFKCDKKLFQLANYISLILSLRLSAKQLIHNLEIFNHRYLRMYEYSYIFIS